MLVNLVCPHCGMMFPVGVKVYKENDTPEERARRAVHAMGAPDSSRAIYQAEVAKAIRAAIEADREDRR